MTAASKTPAANTVVKSLATGQIDRAWVEGALALLHTPIGTSITGVVVNATTSLLTANPASHGMMSLDYFLVRGTRSVSGHLLVHLHATTPNVTNTATTAVGTTGCSFTVTATGGIDSLNLVVDNADGVTVSIVIYGMKLVYPA